MKLGTHNSMTYLPPKKFWLIPFSFMARCQSKSLRQQFIKYNVRMFDFRIRFDKYKNPVFAHGLMEYKGNVEELLRLVKYYANMYKEVTYVSIHLEWNKKKGLEEQTELFKEWLSNIGKEYSEDEYLVICGGARKYDWKTVQPMKPNAPNITLCASTTWKILDDWFPYLYARIMNKRNKKKDWGTEFICVDFVEY